MVEKGTVLLIRAVMLLENCIVLLSQPSFNFQCSFYYFMNVVYLLNVVRITKLSLNLIPFSCFSFISLDISKITTSDLLNQEYFKTLDR